MASLVSASANMDVDHPVVHATGAKASARSSVEIKDSCNCFKFCFPCWSKKTEKQSDIDKQTTDIARKAMTRSHPEYAQSHSQVRRSPGIDDLASVRVSPTVDIPITVTSPRPENMTSNTQNISITVHCDHSPGTTPQSVSPMNSTSSESFQ